VFSLGALRADCKLRDQREQIILSSFMVPYGQATHSPDRERQLTFRSQKIDEHIIIIIYEGRKIGRPSVKTARMVPFGQASHSEAGENIL